MGHQVILSIWISFIVVCVLRQVNSSTNSCGSDIDSSSVPMVPPKIDVGGYMVYQNYRSIMRRYPTRDIYIYWRGIPESDKCGKFIEYRVVCSSTTKKDKGENINDVIIIKTEKNHVKFENLNTNVQYKCIVHSLNKHGASEEYSKIVIPRESDRNSKQLSVTRKSYNTEFLELSWNNVKPISINDSNANQTYDYTLFWCEHIGSQPYTCSGLLNWTHISSNDDPFLTYMLTINDNTKNYNFAVSLNSYLNYNNDSFNQMTSESTGMSWESCQVQLNNCMEIMPGKINSIEINLISSKGIQMHWRSACSNGALIVQGYHVVYCPIAPKISMDCTGPIVESNMNLQYPYGNRTVILKYGHITVLGIFGIKPLTTYKISVSAFTDSGIGLPSDPIILTTQREGSVSSNKTGGAVLPWRLQEGFNIEI